MGCDACDHGVQHDRRVVVEPVSVPPHHGHRQDPRGALVAGECPHHRVVGPRRRHEQVARRHPAPGERDQRLAGAAPHRGVRPTQQLAQEGHGFGGVELAEALGDRSVEARIAQAQSHVEDGQERRVTALEHGRQHGPPLRRREVRQVLPPEHQLGRVERLRPDAALEARRAGRRLRSLGQGVLAQAQHRGRQPHVLHRAEPPGVEQLVERVGGPRRLLAIEASQERRRGLPLAGLHRLPRQRGDRRLAQRADPLRRSRHLPGVRRVDVQLRQHPADLLRGGR